MKKTLFLIAFCLFGLAACSPAVPSTPTSIPTRVPTKTVAPTETSAPVFMLSSPAFANEQPVPLLYTCSGSSFSPPLTWNEPPTGTKTFALIAEDPDAGGYTHWVIYDIPAESRSLPENVAKDQELGDGMYQGFSGGAVFGYVGLCPPNKHRYSFKLFALDLHLEKKQGVGKKLLQDAMVGHILAQSELIGTFAP